jgi:excinuclease ABC subunit C
VIDGGKGQLSAAVESLKSLNIYGRVTIIGIAKRLEEIFFPEDNVPLLLSKKSPTLKVIQQARNEAHRFAIEFHRNIRSKKFITTQLTKIPGIGKKTAEKLLSTFGSVEKVKIADPALLEEHIGKAATKKVLDYFNNPPPEEEEEAIFFQPKAVEEEVKEEE